MDECNGRLIFASNWGCVTSQGAKIAPADIDCSGGIDCAWCGSLGWREPVCAITGCTSKDSTGTEPKPRRSTQNPQHERHSVGWTRTERHHDSANIIGDWSQVFSRGKNIPAARSFSLA